MISNSSLFEAIIVWISFSVSIFPLMIRTAFLMIVMLSPPLFFAAAKTLTKSSTSSCPVRSANWLEHFSRRHFQIKLMCHPVIFLSDPGVFLIQSDQFPFPLHGSHFLQSIPLSALPTSPGYCHGTAILNCCSFFLAVSAIQSLIYRNHTGSRNGAARKCTVKNI